MTSCKERLLALAAAGLFLFNSHEGAGQDRTSGARGGDPPAHKTPPSKSIPLVKNGGFEKGDPLVGPEGWQPPDGLCSFWVKDPERGGRMMKFDTNVLVAEYRARRKEMAGKDPPPARSKTPVGFEQRYLTVAAHDGAAFLSDPIPVEPGRRYRLKVDCRAELEGREKMEPKIFVIGYMQVKGEERRGYQVHQSCEAGSKWRTFTIEFGPASRSGPITCMRVMLFPYWPPGVYYFDNVAIEALPLDRKAPGAKEAGEKDGSGETKDDGDGREPSHA